MIKSFKSESVTILSKRTFYVLIIYNIDSLKNKLKGNCAPSGIRMENLQPIKFKKT